MPGQSRLDGHLHGLPVANFADHHNIGVLTQKSAQPVRECNAGLRVDLGLTDPRKHELHGIFDRHDILFLGVDLGK